MVRRWLYRRDLSNQTLSRNPDPSPVSDQISSVPGSHPESSGHTVDSRVAPENKPSWGSTAYATTKLAINLVKESSDIFPPLKSVVGGLSVILDHCDVEYIPLRLPHPLYSQPSQQTITCRKTIESLLPRVEGLVESLSVPAPGSEIEEEKRREVFKR